MRSQHVYPKTKFCKLILSLTTCDILRYFVSLSFFSEEKLAVIQELILPLMVAMYSWKILPEILCFSTAQCSYTTSSKAFPMP